MDTASNLVFELVFIRALSLALHHCVRGSIQTVPYICPWELLYADDFMIRVHVHRGTSGKVEDIEI